jgi:hypothetical protein
MESAFIVEHLDVIKDAQTRLFSCFIFLMVNEFVL